MPTRISPSILGARAAKELLLRLERLTKEAASKGDSLDLVAACELLSDALGDPRAKKGVLMALAEYLAAAIEGSNIDLQEWHPLEQFDRQHKDSSPSVKRW